MQKHRRYFSEEFSLTEVMTRPPAFIYLIAGAGFLVAGLMDIFMLQPLLYRGSLPIAFGCMILVMMLLLKTQAKDLTISLGKKSIVINGVGYDKTSIECIDTYAYDLRKQSKIYFHIKFTNGKSYYITSARLFVAQSHQQADLLKRLINGMKKHLDIELTRGPNRSGRATYHVKP
ncbi:hypothetical protein OC25_02100 [Pedobacter kyungheensis]|uniref:Uncharacterized protein n=1 Tax=Pedobacter kyungheensis TaxID=1069985 RepID=A0A0C1G8X8_9SPHI|nr:hypothetical protein [Pedobacter kyungheensis]KIA96559.1 hypothetical protein OC25_02100 [Pedobacter kyungheensis]